MQAETVTSTILSLVKEKRRPTPNTWKDRLSRDAVIGDEGVDIVFDDGAIFIYTVRVGLYSDTVIQ